MNVHVERLIQTVQTEYLDRFIVMGTSHLDYLAAEYIRHYNRPPAGAPPPPRMADDRAGVRCRTRLDGVLHPVAVHLAARRSAGRRTVRLLSRVGPLPENGTSGESGNLDPVGSFANRPPAQRSHGVDSLQKKPFFDPAEPAAPLFL